MAHTKVTKTYSQNTGVANTFSYSGSFDVFKATEVEVDLDNVKLTYTASTINESASPREYTVDTSAKTVHIGGANLSSGTIVIQPVTDMGAPTPRADYAPGSSVTSEDLNNNQLQLMRKAMEYDEQKLSSRGDTMTGHLTMGEDQTIIFEGATDDGYETTLTVTDPTADRTITLPNVTGTVVTTGDTGTVTATMLAANSVDSSELVDGSIDTSHIGNLQVTTDKIGPDAVTGAKIADDAIDSEHYTDGSIDTAHIADDSISNAKMKNNAITAAEIADDVINSRHYVAGSVDTEHIADANVTTAKIADANVTTAKIADANVTTAKITDANVTTAKLANNAVTTAKITDANVTTAKIASNAITTAKIGSAQVTSVELATDSVQTAKILNSNVTTAKIAADAITGAKIADDAIDSEHYTDASIDTAHISDANVTTAKIADANVTTAKITDANVTTDKLAADSVTIAKIGCEQTTISDSDSHLPTSGAVVDYVAAQIAPIGGLEVIATDAAFPNTQPAAGVVISIADAGGLVVNGSGTSTTGRTVGSSTVTINNINSQFNSTTIAAGVGMLVSSTGSGQIYNYHKATLKEADLINLSTDIDDFGNRYRVHSGEPSSNNDDGDLVWDTNANKMKVYDSTASAWKEVTSTGDFKFLVAVDAGTTTAASWDGSDTSFDLKETTNSGSAASISNINQLIVSLNGVIQKPNTGSYSASEEGFYLTDTDTIRFCTAPPAGSTSFILQCGSAVSIPTPGDGTVTTAKIASAAVTTAKIAKPLDFADDEKARFGTGNDLEIYHSGSHSHIRDSGTGNLNLDASQLNIHNPTATEVCARFIENDAVKLYFDHSEKFKTTSTGAAVTGTVALTNGNVTLSDGYAIQCGASQDLQLFHTAVASENRIDNQGFPLHIRGTSGETRAKFIHDGAVELYYDNVKTFETTTNGAIVYGTEGAGAQFYLYADEGDDDSDKWRFSTGDNGNVYFQDYADGAWETNTLWNHGGNVELYFDNAKKFETTSTGVQVTGNIDIDGNIDGADGSKIKLGTGDDFKLHHDGSNSFIENDTGVISSWSAGNHEFKSSNGNTRALFKNGDACELYYNNSKKFETTSEGVLTTGYCKAFANSADSDYTSSTNSHVMQVQNGGHAALVVEHTSNSQPLGIKLHFSDDDPDDHTQYFITALGGSGGNVRFQVWSDGDVRNHDNSYAGTSDVKLKENIVDANSQWADVKAVKVRNFNFKSDTPSDKRLGVIAQEIETISPGLVDNDPDLDAQNQPTGTTTKAVKYSILYMKAFKALQEAMAKIETLETKVAALEAK